MNINSKQAIQKELVLKALEEKTVEEREDLIKFMQYMFKYEKKKDFFAEDYHYLLADKLKGVLSWKTKRLMINIPPRHGKSELITKCFPVWAFGNNPTLEIIATSYSATLAQGFSSEARDYYNSETYQKIFPRADKIHDSQNTKDHWKLESGWKYYSTGSGGAITGIGANCFIIDDPLKPDEVDSDIKRIGINDWYENTVTSRLNNPKTDSIIIIMQRLHDNDLCGYLKEKMEQWVGEDWDIVSLPAINEDEFSDTLSCGREIKLEEDKPLFPSKFTPFILQDIKQVNPLVFNCQWMQNPISKENQEFHEEWFNYYDELPKESGRVFTTVDPAFSKSKRADESVITTVKFIQDNMYILEQTAWKYDPAELEDKMLYHIKKWNPESIWVEAIAAQVTISFSLKRRLAKEQIFSTVIEEIRQKQDKNAKIRALIPLFRNGLIHHKRDMWEFEAQLLKFPRWRHDDRIDCTQMALYLYELQPWQQKVYKIPTIKHNKYGMPVLVK